MKKCGKCKIEKPKSSFYKSKSTLDSLQNRCKECAKESIKLWKSNNKEKNKLTKKIWDNANKERNLEYRRKNKDKISKNTKNWYLKNKEKKLNRERDRLINDPVYKLKHNIRRNIKRSIVVKGYSKTSKTSDILKCDYSFLCSWLGLSDFNGDWHIDHIIPLSLAKTEKEVILLNHYSNLQLLSPKENLTKGDRFILKKNYLRVLNNHPQPLVISRIVDESMIKII